MPTYNYKCKSLTSTIRAAAAGEPSAHFTELECEHEYGVDYEEPDRGCPHCEGYEREEVFHANL